MTHDSQGQMSIGEEFRYGALIFAMGFVLVCCAAWLLSPEPERVDRHENGAPRELYPSGAWVEYGDGTYGAHIKGVYTKFSSESAMHKAMEANE